MIKVLRFTAAWCAPCKIMGAFYNELKEENKDVEFEDVDIELSPERISNFRVVSIPTIIFLKDNIEVDRLNGFKTKNKIQNVINQLKST